MRRQLGEVVAAMLQIAGADPLDDATRQLAAEFLITLCEARDKAPGMMRKLPSFAEQIFQIMLKFLLDIEVRPAFTATCSTSNDTLLLLQAKTHYAHSRAGRPTLAPSRQQPARERGRGRAVRVWPGLLALHRTSCTLLPLHRPAARLFSQHRVMSDALSVYCRSVWIGWPSAWAATR
jgi:Importin repeat